MVTVDTLLKMYSSLPLLMIFVAIGGAFGGNRGARPVPPEKGVFPLDHMHLCDLVRRFVGDYRISMPVMIDFFC